MSDMPNYIKPKIRRSIDLPFLLSEKQSSRMAIYFPEFIQKYSILNTHSQNITGNNLCDYYNVYLFSDTFTLCLSLLLLNLQCEGVAKEVNIINGGASFR